MAVTYSWQGFVDTGMQDDGGRILVDVYTCSTCHGTVCAPARDEHTDFHEPPEEPEPEE